MARTKTRKAIGDSGVPVELTEAEWAIMTTVWDRQPVAAPTVQEALVDQRNWTYSTVKTIMDRMVEKGLLTTEKIRNLFLYRAAVTQDQARRSEILRTLQRAFKGALTPMMQFLLNHENLSEKELADLEAMVKVQKAKHKSEHRTSNTEH
jgi:BlaI family transcriptional regulator, penicillinase repressor